MNRFRLNIVRGYTICVIYPILYTQLDLGNSNCFSFRNVLNTYSNKSYLNNKRYGSRLRLLNILKTINNRNSFDLRYGIWQTANSVENNTNSFRSRTYFQRHWKFHAIHVKVLFKLYIAFILLQSFSYQFVSLTYKVWRSKRIESMKYSKIKNKLSDICTKIYIKTEALNVASIFYCTFAPLLFELNSLIYLLFFLHVRPNTTITFCYVNPCNLWTDSKTPYYFQHLIS